MLKKIVTGSFYIRKSINFIIVGCLCGIIPCFFSCGLDVFYYLDRPSVTGGGVIKNPKTPESRVFSFITAPNSSQRDIFQGTAVYYRLYNDFSRMNSDMSSISSVNTELYSDKGMTRLLSYGYQPMVAGNGNPIMIPVSEGTVTVSVRPFSEGGYQAAVSVNGTPRGEPMRTPLRRGFTFFPENEAYPEPVETDIDTQFSNTDADGWWLAAYAVSVGQSPDMTPVYSQVEVLGYLYLDAGNTVTVSTGSL